MKKITTAVLCFFLLQQAHAQVSDSAVKLFSNYICNCIDTLNFNKPEEELKKEFGQCRSYGLANLLNMQLLTPEVLTDEKKAAGLEKRLFKLLAEDCEAINRLLAATNKVPAYREKNADNIFTSVDFFKAYGLKPGEVNNLLHVYNNTESGEVKYQRVVDIRWTFETEVEALEWHRKKMRENSEDGELVKEPIEVEGATALKIFREGAGAKKMLQDFGIKQRHHYFLFVYKNIACKVFIATDDKTESKELVPFAAAAITQLRTVMQ